MKRNIPVLLFLIMPLLTFSQEPPVEYFEGQIFYDVEYSEVDEGYSANWLELNLGSRMVLTFKNGNTKKEVKLQMIKFLIQLIGIIIIKSMLIIYLKNMILLLYHQHNCFHLTKK